MRKSRVVMAITTLSLGAITSPAWAYDDAEQPLENSSQSAGEVDGEFVRVSIGYIFANGREVCCSASEYKVTNGKVSFLRTG